MQEAVLIDPGEVAGRKPSVLENGGALHGVVEVAAEDVRPFDAKKADAAGGKDRSRLGIGQPVGNARQESARRSGAMADLFAGGLFRVRLGVALGKVRAEDRGGFGEPVALDG